MNWLTYILAVYLLALSLWPCADEALSIAGQSGGVEVMAASVPGSPLDHHHHDQCSPFCTCACCAATVTTPPPFFSFPYQSVLVSRLAVVLTIAYPAALPAGLRFAIWQPPKHRV